MATMEERMAILESWQTRVHRDLYGNGEPGLVEDHYIRKGRKDAVKIFMVVVSFLASISTIIEVARALHWIK